MHVMSSILLDTGAVEDSNLIQTTMETAPITTKFTLTLETPRMSLHGENPTSNGSSLEPVNVYTTHIVPVERRPQRLHGICGFHSIYDDSDGDYLVGWRVRQHLAQGYSIHELVNEEQ